VCVAEDIGDPAYSMMDRLLDDDYVLDGDGDAEPDSWAFSREAGFEGAAPGDDPSDDSGSELSEQDVEVVEPPPSEMDAAAPAESDGAELDAAPDVVAVTDPALIPDAKPVHSWADKPMTGPFDWRSRVCFYCKASMKCYHKREARCNACWYKRYKAGLKDLECDSACAVCFPSSALANLD
jgi:hypothetical protein